MSRRKGRNHNKKSHVPIRSSPASLGMKDGQVWNSLSEAEPMSTNPVLDNVPYKVVQTTYQASAFTTSTSTPQFVGFQFNVNSLDQIASLQALFDQYRITLIEAWLTPTNPVPPTSGQVVSVIDYDDAGALSNFASGLDYQNAVTFPPICAIYRRFKPRVAPALYSGAFTSFGNQANQWIDAASPSVQHYGLKFGATVFSTAITYDLKVRIHMEWKNLR